MKAQLQAELAAAPDDGTRENITAAFAAREKALGKTSSYGWTLKSRPLFAHPTPHVCTLLVCV